jgi:hypothetical protein
VDEIFPEIMNDFKLEEIENLEFVDEYPKFVSFNRLMRMRLIQIYLSKNLKNIFKSNAISVLI